MKITEFRKLIREEIRKVLKEAQLDPKNQELKNRYIADYISYTIDPTYYGENDEADIQDIEAHAKQYGYEVTLDTIAKMDDVRKLRSKFSKIGYNVDDPLVAKQAGMAVDNLMMRDPMQHLTKSGKMSKLDIDRLKLRIKKNLKLT